MRLSDSHTTIAIAPMHGSSQRHRDRRHSTNTNSNNTNSTNSNTNTHTGKRHRVHSRHAARHSQRGITTTGQRLGRSGGNQ